MHKLSLFAVRIFLKDIFAKRGPNAYHAIWSELLGPVVQRIVSLTSLLVVKMLTILYSSKYII